MNSVSSVGAGDYSAIKAMRAIMQEASVEASKPSRGERIVAKFDSDGDGAISTNELAGTKLGKRMSVDKFERLDKDDSGTIDASEFDAARKKRRGGGATESAVTQQFADFMAAKIAEARPPQDDVATRIIAKLDADANGALNSEEIAGTRLYEAIGDKFFDFDADASGTLDKAELSEFIVNYLTDSGEDDAAVVSASDGGDVAVTTASTAAEVVDSVAAVAEADDIDDAEAAESDDDAVEASEAAAINAAATSGEVSQLEIITAAFEAALEILRNGNTDTTVSPVEALYQNAQSAISV